MVAELKVKSGGVWRTITAPEVRYSGAWRVIKEIEVKISGAWQTVFMGIVYTLSGTTGAPNSASDYNLFPDDSLAGWRFYNNGEVWKVETTTTQFRDGIEWSSEQPTVTVDAWIRATYYSGDSPNSGDTLNTWHKVGNGSNRAWLWSVTGAGSEVGVIKVEIATDSGGSDIVATGYYRGSAIVDV